MYLINIATGKVVGVGVGGHKNTPVQNEHRNTEAKLCVQKKDNQQQEMLNTTGKLRETDRGREMAGERRGYKKRGRGGEEDTREEERQRGRREGHTHARMHARTHAHTHTSLDIM